MHILQKLCYQIQQSPPHQTLQQIPALFALPSAVLNPIQITGIAQLYVPLLNKIDIQSMSSTPILNPEQIDELNNMVHGILQENKKKLDDALSELVQVENTSILSLYKLVCEEWNKKQKIVDNLCHFSLTMMATVQLLWEHKFDQQEKMEAAELHIHALQRDIDELTDINEMHKLKISEAQTKIQTFADAKEKFEELIKSQSCIGYDEQVQCGRDHLLTKKCSACQLHETQELETTELIKQNSKVIVEKDQELQNLRLEKVKLEQQLQQAIEESQLTKMELELAEIAIKDALTYKTSYKSLLEQNASRLSEAPRPSNIHYYNQEVEEGPGFADSFKQEGRNILSNQFACREDIIHFASTPCLLLNESIEKFNLDNSVSSLRDELELRMAENNPFKKKTCEASPNIFTNGIKEPIQKNPHIEKPMPGQEHSKTLDLNNSSNNSSFYDPFLNRYESAFVDERKINELISKFKIKQSKISDKEETEQSSMLSNPPLKSRKGKGLSQSTHPHMRSAITLPQTKLSKFYSFVTNKVVKSRIKVK